MASGNENQVCEELYLSSGFMLQKVGYKYSKGLTTRKHKFLHFRLSWFYSIIFLPNGNIKTFLFSAQYGYRGSTDTQELLKFNRSKFLDRIDLHRRH